MRQRSKWQSMRKSKNERGEEDISKKHSSCFLYLPRTRAAPKAQMMAMEARGKSFISQVSSWISAQLPHRGALL